MTARTSPSFSRRQTGARDRHWRQTAVPILLLMASGCVSSEPAPSASQTQAVGYAAPAMPAGPQVPASSPAGTDGIVAGAITKSAADSAPTMSRFHNMLLVPYRQTPAEIEASLAVEDDMGRNPDGSFRLPPPIRIPIIDISQSYTALANNPVFEVQHPVDITVPW